MSLLSYLKTNSRARWQIATAACLGSMLFLAGCTVGPKYHRPPVETPPAYKEVGNWKSLFVLPLKIEV